MNREFELKIVPAILTLWLALCASATLAQTTANTAFIDVNVVPMDREHVLRLQTVLVQGGSIAALGPASTRKIPADVQRVVGHGSAFLLPGLSDMHVHVSEAEDLALYVANGVTTVLHLGGDPVGGVGTIKQDLESGDVVSPRVFFALKVDGAGTYGFVVDTPERARNAVDLAKANGYDFIKVYNALTRPVFDAIVAESRNAGLAVIGHGVRAVGLNPLTVGPGMRKTTNLTGLSGATLIAHMNRPSYVVLG